MWQSKTNTPCPTCIGAVRRWAREAQHAPRELQELRVIARKLSRQHLDVPHPALPPGYVTEDVTISTYAQLLKELR